MCCCEGASYKSTKQHRGQEASCNNLVDSEKQMARTGFSPASQWYLCDISCAFHSGSQRDLAGRKNRTWRVACVVPYMIDRAPLDIIIGLGLGDSRLPTEAIPRSTTVSSSVWLIVTGRVWALKIQS